MSKSQLDRLGERLRESATPREADRDLYETYRQSHARALSEVMGKLVQRAEEEPSSRLKTIESVVAKLQRQSIRLSQISDIAGCRLIVSDTHAQEEVRADLRLVFPDAQEVDYRLRPQNGYRAVHLIVSASDGNRVEIQLRTTFQNAWANVSESAAKRIDMALKYGGGPREASRFLHELSDTAAQLDARAEELVGFRMARAAWERPGGTDEDPAIRAGRESRVERLNAEISRQELLLKTALAEFDEMLLE